VKKSNIFYFPAGVSSIFQICYEGNRELIYEGARGGGFRIKKGVYTYGEISEKDEVFINGIRENNAKTSFKVIELMKKMFGINEGIRLYHNIEIPIGSGFGSSAAGALGAAFAINDLFNLNVEKFKLAEIAHIAEILSLTGLGTVSGLFSFKGSVGLIIKEGAPGICEIKELNVDEDVIFVSINFKPIEKSSFIVSEEKKKIINEIASDLILKIQEEGTAEALLKYSRIFAERTKIADSFILNLTDYLIKLGFIGATQNMIGYGVHGLIKKEKYKMIEKELKRKFLDKIIISELQDKLFI